MSTMRGFLLALFLVTVSCGPAPQGTSESTMVQPASTERDSEATAIPDNSHEPSPGGVVFHNGNILTMDETNPNVQAIWIVDDRIQAVGSNDDVSASANGLRQSTYKGKLCSPDLSTATRIA